MVTSLGRCCWPGRRVSQSPECWSSCNVQGKTREGGEDDGKGMVSDVEGMWSLGGRETLSSMRDGICVCVCVAVVVVVVALIRALRMVVLVTINPAGFTSITMSSSLGNFSPHHSTFFLFLHFPHSIPFSLCLPLCSGLVFVWFSLSFLSLTLELILIPLPITVFPPYFTAEPLISAFPPIISS